MNQIKGNIIRKKDIPLFVSTDPAPLTAPVFKHLWAIRSRDGATVWEQPVDITSQVKIEEDQVFLGTEPGVGIVLSRQKNNSKNGRIVMSFGRQNGMDGIKSDNPWGCRFLDTPVSYSYDGGETWANGSVTSLPSVICQKSVITYPIDDGTEQNSPFSYPQGMSKGRVASKLLCLFQSLCVRKWRYWAFI